MLKVYRVNLGSTWGQRGVNLHCPTTIYTSPPALSRSVADVNAFPAGSYSYVTGPVPAVA